MNAQTTAKDHHVRMQTAFEVVDPTCWRRGTDWKDRIDFSGKTTTIAKVLKHFGVTLEEVLESIVYMTATMPKVTRRPLADGELLSITAMGYRAGPAGDH
jgi:hypothetical protein